jgi:hypothetical protein
LADEVKLTNLEEEILKVAATTDRGRLTPDELAVKVGCSTATIYKRLQNPAFRELFLQTLNNSLAAEVPSVLHGVLERARAGDHKNAKLILELVGAYREEKRVTGDITVRETTDIPFTDDETRKAFARATLKQLVGEEVVG